MVGVTKVGRCSFEEHKLRLRCGSAESGDGAVGRRGFRKHGNADDDAGVTIHGCTGMAADVGWDSPYAFGLRDFGERDFVAFDFALGVSTESSLD